MKIDIIECLEDNYAYVLSGFSGDKCIVVDTPDADPIISFLEREKLCLTDIFNTHHHGDHVAGNDRLKEKYKANIWGSKKDASRIPGLDHGLEDKQKFTVDDLQIEVWMVPGHTSHHIMFHLPNKNILFTGDTLFSMGCGRLFEGSFEEMFLSLQKVLKLPDQTLIYCGHEYSLKNARFAMSVDANNKDLQKRFEEVLQLRNAHKSTVPTTLALEKKINPFLRAKNVEEFKKLRQLRDNF